MQFSILIGAPCFFYKEGFIKACVGAAAWNPNNTTVLAFSAQVIHPVSQMFPGISDTIHSNPMVIDLSEEGIEWNVKFLIGVWNVRHTPKVERNKQYLRGWTFFIEAVRRNLVKVGMAEWVVFGDGDSDKSSSTSEEEEEQKEMQQEWFVLVLFIVKHYS